MAGTFETILQNGIAKGHIPNLTQSSRDWYRAAARDFGAKVRSSPGQKERIDYHRPSLRNMMKENADQLTTRIEPGSMYMYFYDAKHKDTLPFWDRFPLIFPFRVKGKYFYGINLHYLDLPMRAALMDELYSITNNKKFNESTKLKMSYKVLNSASKFAAFKPCVKMYLASHVQSKFLYIKPENWDTCLFLPTEKFVGATKAQVWADSRRKLRGS